ncbi:MAG: hypothetical protein A2655_01360 [Candidatus Yanofskybacteria bacterium RIFCSPHIGHO2_01_FULL_43_42]|uniref:Uncharacterized protein n=1 Tax=Candidatus Yanofskybacteria bacterium RIFCSPLOWO2_01_FULL_43_22 TaxID=1802695 RepID=A0A1F8GGM0_9BACT|nr:MAG: hypothetical protein A2655_01360 [Candidatus Yanofskybacteria bacterium RIFCSPHIGHO2_01_FULL_43_42]OGN13132.1 MAG: hypothetical protein A3D48_02275 [Candidatus Yanofskybacteria bacterium RIFCSPHIGHO2_02_FULL_43_17]OGN24545.1 MAG: hypothetical protein A3A13_00490 [Candidatus Yanofskybacteria bacterium RIFCSPLOWO2_01_FULL_43_22]
MNRRHKRRFVKAMYKVQDYPALDEYGSKIFGRPVRGTWKLFRNIVKMATATDTWRWRNDLERASYPGKVRVPTFEEFATFLLHETAHGWCYFLKDEPSLRDYPTGVDEEQVCWDVSKMVCGMLGISYQEELAELSHQFYRLHLTQADDIVGLERLIEKMPAHLRR